MLKYQLECIQYIQMKRHNSATLTLPTMPSSLIHISEHNDRKWFQRHGKQNMLCLSDELMLKLRQYFNALDSQGCQYISAKDLEKPLIVFGLCENSAEVEKLVRLIDTDNSGVIQFDEFVDIFKIAKNSKQNKARKNKFQKFAKLITGDLHRQIQNKVCIQTSVSQYSRKAIIGMLMKKSDQAMVDGKRIARQILLTNNRKDLLPTLQKFR